MFKSTVAMHAYRKVRKSDGGGHFHGNVGQNNLVIEKIIYLHQLTCL